MAGDATNRIAGFFRAAVLSRLLAPRDFGLLGVTLLMQQWMESFTQTGVDAALIQKKGDVGPDLDTAFTIQVIRGFAVAILLWFLAPAGGWFFEDAEVIPLVRTIGLVPLLWGFTNPAVIYLSRSMDFRRLVIWRLTGTVAGLFAGVALAVILRNVWALVVSIIAARATETITSYWIRSYRPRFRLNRARAQGLLRFGRWVFLLNILIYLDRQADSLVTAKLLGTVSLGYYQLAKQLGMVFLAMLGTHAHGVLFPAFSRIQDDSALCRAFQSTFTVLASIAVPIGCFLSLFAEPIVLIAYGDRWLAMSSALQLLAWAAVAMALSGATRPVFLGSGEPRLSVVASALKVSAFAVVAYPLLSAYGYDGVAAAMLVSGIVGMCFEFLFVSRTLRIGSPLFRDALKDAANASVPIVLSGAVARVMTGWPIYVCAALGVGGYLLVLASRSRLYLTRKSSRTSGNSEGHEERLRDTEQSQTTAAWTANISKLANSRSNPEMENLEVK